MRLANFILIFFAASAVSCSKYLHHERWISNASADTVFVFNPDFTDTTFVIAPSAKVMIYGYLVNDHDQEREECRWLGDTLYIYNSKDSICKKAVSIESNWFSDMGGDEERKQVCTFTVYPDNF